MGTRVLRALGSQRQASRADLILFVSCPEVGSQIQQLKLGGGRGSPHLKEQRVLKKENSALGA